MTDAGPIATAPAHAEPSGSGVPPSAPARQTSRARRKPVPTPLHSGIGLGTLFGLRALAVVFPLAGGLLLYGWRAGAVVAVVVVSAWVAAFVWRRVGTRGRQLRVGHSLTLALPLALILPAHLFAGGNGTGADAPWLLLPAAGITVVVMAWLLGGLGSGRIHPVLITYLLLTVLFGSLLVPHRVLRVDRLLVGDVLNVEPTDTTMPRKDPWIRPPPANGADAIYSEPAGEKLLGYTSGRDRPDRASATLQMLLRDRMPPLEDLILGGQPGPIGAASAVAVVIGGLFLLYRGLIDFRIPLLTTAAAWAALLVLPIPVLITESNISWRWLAFRGHYLGWGPAVTFANYELLAGPLLFTAFFLATSPAIRPLTRRGRATYAVMLGTLTAALQLYHSVATGAYIALLIASLLTPVLDRTFRPRPLV